MRKILLSSFALSLSLGISAQVSVPNGGFEKWNSTKWQDPMYYGSSTDNDAENGVPFTMVQSTDAYHGKYAVQLSTIVYDNDTLAGDFLDGNAGSGSLTGGIPYNQKATGIRFYYKYSRTNANDSGVVLALFKKAGTTIGGAEIKLDTAKNYKLNYTAISLPIAPDSIIFGAVSSCGVLNSKSGYPGSVLIIDSVTFTGVASQPAEFNGDFEQWVADSFAFPKQWNFTSLRSGETLITTDAYTGRYAMQIQSALFSSGHSAPDSSYAQFAITGYYTNNNWPPHGGYPYTKQKDTLEFYYKYTSGGAGDDSAFVTLLFKKGGIFLPSAPSVLLPSAAVYTRARLPFNLSSAPDSVIVSISNQKHDKEAPSYATGNVMKVDNVRFLSQTVAPVAGFNSSIVVCQGSSINYTDTTQNLPQDHYWSFQGGTPPTSGAANPSVLYSTSGTYTVTLKDSNSAGSDSVTKTISVVVKPKVALTGSKSVCHGNSTIITASGGSTYMWSTGSTNDTINAKPASTTSYSVQVTATGGCFADSTFMVVVNPLPTAAFSATSACPGSAIKFTDGSTISSGIIASWSWNFGDPASGPNNLATTQNPTHIYYTSGKYTTLEQVTSAAGCTDTVSHVVTVNPAPTVTASAGPPSICSGNSTTLTATGSGTTYAWIPATGLSATTGSTVTASPAITTTYTDVTTNTFGCKDTTTVTVSVNPLPNVTVIGKTTITAGAADTLTASGAVTYNWSPSTGLNTTLSGTVIASLASTTTYTVCGANSFGCVSCTSFTVTVVPSSVNNLIANTIITVYPNPSNGIFNCELQMTNDESKHSIKVYNVLGEVVYSENSITGSKFSVNLSDKSPGIYFYQLLDANGGIIDTGKLIIAE